MKLFEFTITIDHFIDDLDVIDSFYGRAGDASIGASGGKTLIHFDREATSLDDALRQAVADVQAEGWRVEEISVEPECLQSLPTP